jgi:hypothetical protein
MWEVARDQPLRFEDELGESLALYVRVCRARADLAGRALANGAIALVRFERSAAMRDALERRTLVNAFAGGSLADLHAIVGASDAEVMGPLLRCAPCWLRDAGAAHQWNARADLAGDSTPVPRHTAFGGIFLLLPLLSDLPLAAATRGWPDLDGSPAIAMVRLLLLAKCCGRQHAGRALLDPVVRDVAGIAAAFAIEDLHGWQAAVTSAQLKRFVREVAGSPACRDAATPRGNRRDCARSLAWSSSLCPVRALDRALSVAACAVMRAFAWRLPGFAESSMPFLHHNFLDFAATMHEEPGRRVVRVGRPPLHLVLGLTGMTRATYRVGWLDDRPFAIFQDE